MNNPLFLFVGKSASGKTTIANRLEEKYNHIQVQSYTTRPPRYEGEVGHIFVTDDEGKKYRAEVFDIFKVEGYDDNQYIMYSFGESVDDSNERVYISRVVEAGDSYNLVEISDEKEWDAVNKTIQANLESLGEDNE